MWQVSGNTFGQIAKLSLVISTIKAKGSVFVTKRVHQIHDNSHTNQWHYVDTKSNPADDASRGLDVTNTNKFQRCYNGPAFLWCLEKSWSESKCHKNLFKFCINLVRRKDIRLDKNEKDHWVCSGMCSSTEVKAVTTIRCINSYIQWCGRYWVVGKGKHQNNQDAAVKRIYWTTKDYKESTQAKSQH